MTRRMKITKEVKDLLLEYQELINNGQEGNDREFELYQMFKNDCIEGVMAVMLDAKTRKFVILVKVSDKEAKLIENIVPEE